MTIERMSSALHAKTAGVHTAGGADGFAYTPVFLLHSEQESVQS
jgi:inosine/xanthosine triphosphate pyrophosphatase family protein